MKKSGVVTLLLITLINYIKLNLHCKEILNPSEKVNCRILQIIEKYQYKVTKPPSDQKDQKTFVQKTNNNALNILYVNNAEKE